MRLRLVLPLALLLLPAPAHAEDPLATAEALADGTVRVVAAVDEDVVGRVLALCDPREAREGQTLLGYVRDDCFAMLEESEDVGPLGIGPACAMATVTLAPNYQPPVEVVPDFACTWSVGPWMVRLATDLARLVLESLPVEIEYDGP